MTRYIFAAAKINLSLRVGPPGSDGRHPLDSLVCFTKACGDSLKIEPAEGLTLRIEGPFSQGLDAGEENLVLRAVRLLRDAASISCGAAITLDKRLPTASGIGGGSADAAAALIALNELWSCGLSIDQLQKLSSGLGADVPACVLGISLHMTGTGEVIREIPPLPRLGIVLVNPLIPCPTGPVYHQYDQLGTFATITRATLPDVSKTTSLLDYLGATPNDLELSARALVPEIGEVLAAISASPKVLLARMSGSGATCFGLYADAFSAQAAAHHIQKSLASFPIWVEADVIR